MNRQSSYLGQLWKVSLLILGPTMFVSTNFLDPINWPKQIALLVILPVIVFEAYLVARANVELFRKVFLYFVSCIILVNLAAFLNFENFTRTLWGAWGRNNGLLTLVSLFTIAFVTAILRSFSSDFSSVFLRALSLAFIPASIYGLMQTNGTDPIIWSNSEQVFSFFGNTNFASTLFALSAGASVLGYFSKPSRFLGYVFLIQGFSCAYLVFQTNSIQGLVLLAIFFGLLIFLGSKARNYKVSIGLLCVLTIAGILALVSFFGRGPLGGLLFQYTLKLRSFYWSAGVEAGLSNPIAGVGIDSFGDYYREFRNPEVIPLTTIDLTVDNAHNSLIQIFATLGLIGLVAYLALFVPALIWSIRILISKYGEFSWSDVSVAVLFIGSFLASMISIDNIAVAIVNWSLAGTLAGGFFAKLFASHLQKSSTIAIQSRPAGARKARRSSEGKIESLRPVVLTISTLSIFALSWSYSSADRDIYRFYGTVVSQQDRVSDQTLNDLYNFGMSSDNLQESQFEYAVRAMELTTKIDPLALNVAERALEKFPQDFRLLDRYAVLSERLGRTNQALMARERQLSIEPTHPRVLAYYAKNLFDSGNLTGARDFASKAYEFAMLYSDQGTLEYLKLLEANLK